MIFFFIVLTCLIGGFLSLSLSYFFLKNSSHKIIANMVSLAVGTLLGTAFLEIIPHSIEISNDVHQVSLVILLGIFALFVLEKFFIWRHCHGSHCEAHSSENAIRHNNNGSLILIGNCFHNFIDGILIASAFMVNTNLGFVTALAIFAHELPQEISNVSILVHSGFTKVRALWFNFFSSISTVIGGILAFLILDKLNFLVPFILSFSASTMLYIAVSDLIPSLHKKSEPSETIIQIIMIAIVLLIIFVIHSFLH